MHSRNRNGWRGILGSEDLTEDHERTDPNVEMPAFGEVGSEEKTTIAHNPTLKPKLTLPRPQSSPAEQPPPALEFAVEVDQIVQKLEPEKKDSPGRKKKDERLFTKEVILTMVGGFLLLIGAVAYTRSNDEPPPTQQVVAPPPATPAKPPPKPEPSPEPKVETTMVAAPTTRKATTPILSILSIPSGARVEIDGTIYGSTPLIQPSPPKVKNLSIRLLKDNYKIFETVLTPNEAGHFNLNATLEKR